MMRIPVLLFMAVFLAACESLPVIPTVSQPQQNLLAHAGKVNGLASWTLEGRISISFEDESWHASLFWHQVSDIYQLRLLGPFGQGSVQLDGSSHAVVLQSSEGEFRASSADQLLAEQFGWRIPVEGLKYWATGQPVPGMESSMAFDETGRLSELKQDGWLIRYRGYVDANGLVMPSKVFLKHDTGVDLRLVIDNWKTRAEQVAAQ